MKYLSYLLRPLRRAHTFALLAPAPPQVKPVPLVDGHKLNLGCGFDIRPGWINIDLHARHNPDMVCDVTNLVMIEDATASYVLAQDILEHIHREKCASTIQEWNRVLKIGGMIEIRVPDVLAIARLMVEDEQRSDLTGHRKMLHCLFGTQGYQGDFHFNGFTELTLRDDLDSNGFVIRHLVHHDEWLFEVIAEKVVHHPPEHLLKIADDGDFLKEAYQTILQREIDPGGKDYCTELLASGTPREAVLVMLRSSDEARAVAERSLPAGA